MESFTPLTAMAGGSLIGLAAAVLWLGIGRIAGISGMFAQIVPMTQTVLWRLVFLAALIAGAWGAHRILPGLVAHEQPALVPAPLQWGVPMPIWLALSGLLVGFGTRMANGCTSGHGVCGVARLSRRSIAAVAVFFSVAILTVTVTGIV